MSVVIVLLGFSLLIACGFLIAYLWAVKNGQFDDKYTPSIRILFEDKKTNSAPGGFQRRDRTSLANRRKSVKDEISPKKADESC